MRICLIAEGSYPYVTGGVSSWINQLARSMPEHEFTIIAINPDSSRKGKYKYELPPNVVSLQDVFMDEIFDTNGRWNQMMPFSDAESRTLEKLLEGRWIDWNVLFRLFRSPGMRAMNAMDILMSREFYDLVREAYKNKYDTLPFLQVYWTLRSMFLIVYALLLTDYPKADIYHAVSTGYAGLIGAYAAHVHQGAFVVTEHGIYTREREEEIIKAEWVQGNFKNIWIDFFYLLSRCAYDRADRVVALFSRNKEIQIEIGCKTEKITVIHNGIDITRYEMVAASVENRRNPRPIRVGAVVRIVPIKDIMTMLQSFALVNQKRNDVEFIIMGPNDEDKEYYAECVEYQKMLNLNNVVFTGSINILDYLKDMDLLVLTSISEGQPLAILEGLACKLPFVTTQVGDCGALVNGESDAFGAAGRVVPIMDYAGIADGILELCAQERMRREMGQAGFQRVAGSYSFKAFIDGYRKIYGELERRG